MVNYQSSKVFTIRNRVNDKKFVSFTTKRLCEVFNNYKQKFKRGTADNPLMHGFRELGIENFFITLEEEVQASNKDVVNQRVNHYICQYDTFNNGFNYTRVHKKNMKIDKEPIDQVPIHQEPEQEAEKQEEQQEQEEPKEEAAPEPEPEPEPEAEPEAEKQQEQEEQEEQEEPLDKNDFYLDPYDNPLRRHYQMMKLKRMAEKVARQDIQVSQEMRQKLQSIFPHLIF